MIEKLNKKDIESLLQEQFIARLGFQADGKTYVVPINYVYDGTYLYAHAIEGRKMNMMRKNPKVCVEVDDYTDMWRWKTVIAWGQFEELSDSTQKLKALNMLLQRELPLQTTSHMHLTASWPFSDDELEEVEGVVYRIKLGRKSGQCEFISVTPAGVV